MQLMPFMEMLPFLVTLAPMQCPAASHGLACPGFHLSRSFNLVQACRCCSFGLHSLRDWNIGMYKAGAEGK